MQSQTELDNSKSTALSGICQAVWPQKCRKTNEPSLPSSPVAGAPGGMAVPCGGCAAVVFSSIWCRGAENWRETYCEHQLWPVNEQREAAVPLMGSFGGLLAANQWEDGEGSAATRGMTGDKKMPWRRNTHYPKADWSAEIWEMLFACQMKKSNAVGVLLTLVFNKNLCSDETGTPICCFAIVFMTASKAHIFCHMRRI